MRVFVLLSLLLAGAVPALATDSGTQYDGFLGSVETAIHSLADWVFATINIAGVDVEWIVIWMALPMVLLTFYFGFINLSSFKRAFKILRGDYAKADAPGEVSQFQALTTALSGTVGLGNIGGVAIAIGIGGPGAMVWMMLIGFFAMSLKFAECTLGVKYRQINADGTVSGGPMYYLERGLKARGWAKTGRVLALSYAAIAIFATVPQMSQVNQAFSQISVTTGLEGLSGALTFGITLAILTGIVIIGGISSIASVTSRLVPLMAGIYLTAAIIIILGNIAEIPSAFATIFKSAFSDGALEGGILGAFVIGMRRAVYSTEAGLGTSSIAHAAARTDEPVSEGMVALMEPFIDTVVICTITALVIVTTGAYEFRDDAGNLLGDIQMTSAAFGSVFPWFPYVLSVAVFLFAFSTIISWGYYSGKVWEFCFGSSKISDAIFKLTFCALLIPGGIWTADVVFDLIDSLYFMMAIPNIIGIYIMAPELKRDIADYIARLKSGEIKETSL